MVQTPTPITHDDLRPYQQEGIARLVKQRRAMLWDQPGMGKTIQASEAATILIQQRLASASVEDFDDIEQRTRTLVVCPGYLVAQWALHLEIQYPTAKVVAIPEKATAKERMLAILSQHDWLVVNKEMLRKYPFITDKYYVMILDESHHYRNPDAQQSKGALELASEIPCVLELTATPVKKDPDDLYMQYHILDPDVISSYHQFINTYLRVTRSGYGIRIDGVRYADKLRQVMARYGVGRTYKEVELQLPKLTQKKNYVTLNKEEAAVYREIAIYWRNQEKTYNNYLSAMQALRQVTACEAKFSAAVSMADDLDGPGVFFCWYKHTAHRLYDMLGHDNAVYIDGTTNQSQRPQLGKSGKHVVCTIAAMSEGVDLSHAEEVVFMEEDWTPGSRVQALSRVRRWSPNQEPDKRIIAHYVMVKGSVDEKVHAATEGRITTIGEIMELEFTEVEEPAVV
jgi:superfamily II DNA or RNA helicase